MASLPLFLACVSGAALVLGVEAALHRRSIKGAGLILLGVAAFIAAILAAFT